MRRHDEPTLDASTPADLYVICPRCKGNRTISVCTDPGHDMFERSSRWEYVNCPGCSGVGSIARESAIEIKRELAEKWAWDNGETLADDLTDEEIAGTKFAELRTLP